jgi:N-acetyl-1-D-myo-inositol-2-amino-2-deoxy-alpha-D-glucopyranoside deacetylase
MAELGVTDHRFLGGAGRFRDSGMMGTPANSKPRAFWRAEQDRALFDAAVASLVEVIREVRPQVMVSYDDLGGYGHPDHIMAHRVATAAATAAPQADYPAAGEPWQLAKFYWTAVPRSARRHQLAVARAADEMPFEWAESGRQAARAGRARHPDRGGRAVLRAVQQPGPAGHRERVLPARQRSAGRSAGC